MRYYQLIGAFVCQILMAALLPTARGHSPSGSSEMGYSAKWAVIIGITEYSGGDGMPRLPRSSVGASALREALAKEFGYPVKEFGGKTDHILCLLDARATHQAIRDAFVRWLPEQKPGHDDCVLVYFAGHGHRVPANGGFNGYLVGVNSSVSGPNAVETCVPFSLIQDELAKLPCRHKAVILDCCYSGLLLHPGKTTGDKTAPAKADKPGDAADDPLAYFLRRQAFWGLTSGLNEVTLNDGALGEYTVFTGALLDELRARADTRRPDGGFTLGQLAPRVRDRVSSVLLGRQIPDYGKLSADTDGEFVFRPIIDRVTPSELSARRRYSLLMQSVPRVWEAGDVKLARWLLTGLAPRDGENDLTGFEWRYWQKVAAGGRLNLASTAPMVGGVAYSSDGRQFATAEGGVVQFWDAETAKKLNRYVHPTKMAQISALTYSPRGNCLACACFYYKLVDEELQSIGEIIFLDPITGVELKSRDPETGAPRRRSISAGVVESLAYSEDGKYLATNSCSGAFSAGPTTDLRVWETEHFKEVFSHRISSFVTVFAFSPNGERLAMRMMEKTGYDSIEIWDVTAGKQTRKLGPFPQMVTACAFHPRFDWLLVASTSTASSEKSAELSMWDLATGESRWKKYGHRDEVSCLAFTADGRKFISASEDRSLKVWKGNVGSELFTLRGHSQPITAIAIRPDGQELVSATRGTSAPAKAPLGVPLPDYVAKKGLMNNPAEIIVWSLLSATDAVEVSESTPVSSLVYSPDGKQLASGFAHRGVVVRDARTGKSLYELEKELPITALAYSPDGKYLAAATSKFRKSERNGSVIIWNAKTGELIRRIPVQDGGVVGLCFHPNGSQLAAACWKIPGEIKGKVFNSGLYHQVPTSAHGELRGWSTEDWSEAFCTESDAPITAVAYAPRLDVLAWATVRRNISEQEFSTTGLWCLGDVKGQSSVVKGQHGDIILGLAFSPDGLRIATTGGDGLIDVWDRDGNGHSTLRGHTDEVVGVTFSPDGRRIASAGMDNVVRVWDAKTGDELVTMGGFMNTVNCVAFSPDGGALAAGGQSGQIRIWVARPQK